MSANRISRREALALLAVGAYGAGGLLLNAGAVAKGISNLLPSDVTLTANRFDGSIIAGKQTAGLQSFAPGAPAPVLRMTQGQPFSAALVNELNEPTTIHWHGLRIPNDQDGVPDLTQPVVETGGRFRYAFTPPDAGTFWYHPHCNTLEQMGHGMTGMLIVDEPYDVGFDSEVVVNLRDFRLGGDGQFIEMFKPRDAARGGTLGTVMTANWQVEPEYEAAAGSLVRLRVAATDVTRLYKLGLTGGAAKLLALDSHPILDQMLPEEVWLGAGQRADFAVRMPSVEGEMVTLLTATGNGPKALVHLRATGADAGRALAELAPLQPNPVAVADLAKAEVIPFTFGWAPGEGLPSSHCGTLGYTFWSINRDSGKASELSEAPLAVLKLGGSYIFRLANETPNNHPIHIHGISFMLLKSNQREIVQRVTDTALLLPNETMDIALVADNPGDWAFHCHVIEHQKSGLAGFIRIA